MKEKFSCRSRRFRMTAIIYVISSIVLPLLLLPLIEIVRNVTAGFVIWISIFVGMSVDLALRYSMPSSFRADRNSVEFRLLFKKINIRYSDIKSIEVTREYAKPQMMHDRGHYNEIIKFVCKNGEYRFENIMDIDFEQTAANPESLTEQFERGRFMRLKNYISKQTGITY